ncbi:MAG TPA: thiopeptide-type bacteriocin biosynthesis protein [Longimicrobium sp.]
MLLASDPAPPAPCALFHAPGHAWLSAHLFVRGNVYGPPGDRVILEVVDPFVRHCLERGWIAGFFFIRYGELGPHVRLRMYGDPGVLAGEVSPALEAWLQDAPAGLLAAPREEPTAVTRPSRAEALRWIAYEPEVERYGGDEGMMLAETLFRASSEACIELMRGAALADRSVRLGRALPALVVSLALFGGDARRAAELARLHRDSFVGDPEVGGDKGYAEVFDAGMAAQEATVRDRVEAFWTAAREGVPLPAPLDGYLDGLAAHRARLRAAVEAGRLVLGGKRVETWDEACRGLLPSYGHMTCNRLGVTYREEGFLLHMIARVLGGGESPRPAAVRPAGLARVPADRVGDGYEQVVIRADLEAPYLEAYRRVRALGGILTSSGGIRELRAAAAPGRSRTSVHYTGRAIDLYIRTGMQGPDDRYAIVRDGGTDERPLWRVYCAGEPPDPADPLHDPALVREMELECALWRPGGIETVRRRGRWICLTDLLAEAGWHRIPARADWRDNYLSVEWWHFQHHGGLVAGHTRFGDELLRAWPASRVAESGLALDAVWTGLSFDPPE